MNCCVECDDKFNCHTLELSCKMHIHSVPQTELEHKIFLSIMHSNVLLWPTPLQFHFRCTQYEVHIVNDSKHNMQRMCLFYICLVVFLFSLRCLCEEDEEKKVLFVCRWRRPASSTGFARLSCHPDHLLIISCVLFVAVFIPGMLCISHELDEMIL